MLSEIFDNIYNIYNSDKPNNGVVLFNYIYDNYATIIELINKVIEYDKHANIQYIFFYKGYTDIDDFYSYFKILYMDKDAKDDKIYENLDIMWKKIAEKFVKEGSKGEIINSLYGNWSFSPESKRLIEKRIEDELS